MTHPNYPDWKITKRFLVDDYPLLLLEKNKQKKVLSEGAYKNIIQFLLNVAKPYAPSSEDVNFIMHQGFISGEGWAISAVFYGHLIQPTEFVAYQADPEFIAELEQYHKRHNKALNEPIWHVSVSSGDWRHAKTFLPQSTVHKLIDLENQLLKGKSPTMAGVLLLSEDEWDMRFGWAAVTGLRPSRQSRLEKYAARYLHKQETNSINIEAARFVFLRALAQEGLLNREFETDSIYRQFIDAGCINLKQCLDNAEYLYGYLQSQVRLEAGLPPVNDIRESCISLDWMFQPSIHSRFGLTLGFDFLVQAELFFMAARPQTLEPLSFEGLQLCLVLDNNKIKLGKVLFLPEENA